MAEVDPVYIPALTPQQRLEQGMAGYPPEPQAVLVAEARYLEQRRKAFGLLRQDSSATAGLAIAGGDVRSAVFGLGLLQALAQRDLLKRFDYLSTVSSGSYTGCALAWWLSGRAGRDRTPDWQPFGLGPFTFPFGTDAPQREGKGKDRLPQRQVLSLLRHRGEALGPGNPSGLTGSMLASLRDGCVRIAVLLSVFLAGIIVFEYFSWQLAFAWPQLAAFYFWAASGLEKVGRLWTGQPVVFPVQYLLYLYTPLLALVLLAVIGLLQGAHAVFPGMTRWNRRIVRFLVSVANRRPADYLFVVLLALVMWLIPFVHSALMQAQANKEAQIILHVASSVAADTSASMKEGAPEGFFDTLLDALSKNLLALVPAGGGLLGILAKVTGLLRRGPGVTSRLLTRATTAGSTFLPIAIFWVAFTIVRLALPDPEQPGLFLLALLGITLVVLAIGWRIDINAASLYGFQRDRLVNIFLPPWSDVADRDEDAAVRGSSLPLKDLAACADVGMPYPLINAALALLDSSEPAWRQRGADSFLFSPLYCGAASTGWRQTAQFYGGSFTLASAMAASGAGGVPAGNTTLRGVITARLLSFFNPRPGLCLGNPRYATGKKYRPNQVHPGLSQMLSLPGALDHEFSHFVQVSDGADFDPLGAYELVRRRARLIVVCDGTADPEYRFEAFQRCARRAAQDFGASLTFDAPEGFARVRPSTELAWPKGVSAADACWIGGTLTYADGQTATLLYLKATLTAELPPALLGLAAGDPSFPCNLPGNAIFDENQFEAYRLLGHHLGTRMIEEAKLAERLEVL